VKRLLVTRRRTCSVLGTPYRDAIHGEGLTMQAAIGYLRVSTREQGRSGLGLAAQRHDIEAFAMREGSESNLGIRTCRPVHGTRRPRSCGSRLCTYWGAMRSVRPELFSFRHSTNRTIEAHRHVRQCSLCLDYASRFCVTQIFSHLQPSGRTVVPTGATITSLQLRGDGAHES
jgi:hypothetical protein